MTRITLRWENEAVLKYQLTVDLDELPEGIRNAIDDQHGLDSGEQVPHGQRLDLFLDEWRDQKALAAMEVVNVGHAGPWPPAGEWATIVESQFDRGHITFELHPESRAELGIPGIVTAGEAVDEVLDDLATRGDDWRDEQEVQG